MTLGLALDELVHALALLAEERELAGLGRDHAVLVALRVLPHLDPGAADQIVPLVTTTWPVKTLICFRSS